MVSRREATPALQQDSELTLKPPAYYPRSSFLWGGATGMPKPERNDPWLRLTLVAKVEPQPDFLVPLTIIVVGGVVDGAGAAWNEGDRLAALRSYGVLDTAPEPAFDCLVQLAAQVCGTPIAAINLIEDRRQWFKAEVGLGLRETPVEVSICARAILHRGPFIVRDMTQDARFACNPLVTGPPYVRFYAGALLETPQGLPLGTLCVLDYHPREL